METRRRTLAKALTWQSIGLVVTTVIGYAATGSIRTGGTLAIASATLGLVTYALHERLWARVHWGRGPRQDRHI